MSTETRSETRKSPFPSPARKDRDAYVRRTTAKHLGAFLKMLFVGGAYAVAATDSYPRKVKSPEEIRTVGGRGLGEGGGYGVYDTVEYCEPTEDV